MSVPPEKEIKRESPVEKAVFRLLNAMTKGSEPPPAVSILLQTLEDAQLLSFCIDAVPYFPHALHYVLHPFTWTESDYNSFYGFFWCCLGALTLNIALMIFVGVQFQKGSFRWMWPLVLLRWLSVLLTTVLFEPLVSIFVMAINCSHDEAGNFVVAAFPEVTCTGAHIPAIILGCIGVLLIVPFGLLINYVFVECEPNSRDPHAKAHGYMELLYMLLKIILVVLEQVSKSRDSKIALLIMLPILITSYARYQPYINQYMNSIRIGNLLSAFFWAIGSLVCQAYDPGNSPVPLTILALCIPLAHAIGKGLVLLSHNLIVGRVIGNLKRKMEYDGRDIEGGKGVDALLGTLSRRRSSIIQSVVLDSTGDVTRSDYAASLAEARHNLPRRLDALAAVGRFKEVAANKKARPTPVFRCPEEVEISCRFLRDSVVDSAALEIMRALFNEGVEQYPKHAGLALSYAYHIATYDTDPSSATYYVEAAEANNPPLDVRFRIFMEKREHEQATHAEDLARSSFNVASYVEFQSLQNQAISSHLNSLMALKAFWQNLLSDQVNDNTIASYMSVMHTSQAKASNFYKRLNARYPNSKQLIRLYAKYAFTVQNNQELGAQLLSQADDIEFREQRTARNKIDVEGSIEKFEGLRRRSGLPLSVDTAQNIEPPKNEPSSPSRKGFRSHLMAIPGSMSGDILANPGGVDEESYKPTVEALFEESGAIHDNHPYVAATGGSALPVTNGPSRVSVMAPPSALSSDYESGAGSAAEEAVDIKRWKPSVAKSATSSITSNKDARKMKAQRVQMKANLLMSINRYTLSGRLWIIVLLGLLIANYNESSKMFRGPGTFLDTLRQETRARRICLTHSILVRQLYIAGASASNSAFNSTMVKLTGQVNRHKTLVLPVLFANAKDTTPIASIVRNTEAHWDSPMDVLILNPYELARLTTQSLERILTFTYQQFTDTATIEQDMDLRMWFDSTLPMCDAFSEFSHNSLVEYKAGSVNRNQVIVALLAVVVLVLLVAAGLFSMGLWRTRSQQRQWLVAIKTLPKPHVKHIAQDLEEEIEELFEMEGMEDRAHSTAAMRMEQNLGRWILWKYAIYFMLAGLVLATLAVALFIPPLLSSVRMDATASVIYASNSRRYYGQSINYLSQELGLKDTKTWAPYQVQREMELRILKLKQLQEAILKGDETTPSIYMFPELDPYVRTGGVCLRSGGCDGRPYNATIGFTRDLVLGGSTYLIDVYLETARRYLDTGDYSLKNPDYLLLSNIEPDIADGLETVDGLLVNLAGSTAASYQRGVHVLFSVTVAYYLAFCAYFFYRVARSIQAQISQMVNVTFWLSPEVVSECPKIQNFIATGAPAPRTEAALSAKKAA